MATSLTTAGLNTRATSFASDFPYLAVCDSSGNELTTNRVHMTDATRISIGTASNGAIVYTVTLPASDFVSLPSTIHELKLSTVSTAGTLQGTVIAGADRTINTGDSIIMTFTQTES